MYWGRRTGFGGWFFRHWLGCVPVFWLLLNMKHWIWWAWWLQQPGDDVQSQQKNGKLEW